MEFTNTNDVQEHENNQCLNDKHKLKRLKLTNNYSSFRCVLNSVSSQKNDDEFVKEINMNKSSFDDARNEYLKLISEINGYSQIKNIYIEVIETIAITSTITEEIDLNNYYITIKDLYGKEKYFTLSEGKFIIIGRHLECDFVSINNNVSRINNVILKYMNQIFVFDLYSLNRTKISKIKNSSGENIPINDDKQTVLKFNDNDSGKLHIGFNTEITFSQKGCIICFDKQRNTSFNPCGHSMMCSECFSQYGNNECPICKTTIINIKNNFLCAQTMEK